MTFEREHQGATQEAPAHEGAVATPGRVSPAAGLDEPQTLPYQQKSLFEGSLNKDLSRVRIHTGPGAEAQADAVGARAFSKGNDIVFNKGEYNPNDPSKDRLLAHEVAHTAQQDGAAPTGDAKTTTPGDSVEKNADAAAGAMTQGAPAAVASAPTAIARKAKGEADAPAEDGGGPGPATAAAPPPPGGGDAGPAKDAGAGAGAKDAKDPKDAIGKEGGGGDFSVQLVGTDAPDKPDVAADVPAHNLEAGKAELHAIGAKMPANGAEGVSAENLKFDKPAGGGAAAAPQSHAPAGEHAPAGGGGGEADLSASPEIAAQITQVQGDAKEALGQAEAESTAFKAEMKSRQDNYENEQHATMLETLKTQSAADKRATLKDMGYDANALKKVKDSELDGIITGNYEKEQRKNKIMGMDPDELKKLGPDQKIQYLVDLGIDRGDLDKAGRDKACKLFDDVMAVAHVPGEHDCKIKISGGFLGIGKKDWIVKVKVDLDGNTTMDVQKDGGWLSKLWGWVKLALPIIAIVLAPMTGGLSLIALAVYQAAVAIKNGDWLGAVIGAATSLVGLGAVTTAAALAKVADIAEKVKNVAMAAQAGLAAAKAKNAGSLLGALAAGAGAFAKFTTDATSKFATTMTNWSKKLDQWGKIISGGQKVAAGIKSGDPLAAIGGAFDSAAAVVGPEGKGIKNIERGAAIVNFTAAGKRALTSNPPDYGAVTAAAMGIANQIKQNGRLQDATKIVNAANRVTTAWKNKDTDPGGLASAALDLASSIQTAKYNAENPEEKDADGKTKPDQGREAILDRYAKANRVVSAAGSAIKAAMQKPRPNYMAALDAGAQLAAELTDNKNVAEAAQITARMNAWTQAINSKNEQAILEAGLEFGRTIDGLRVQITEARKKAKTDVEGTLQPGDKMPEPEGGPEAEIPRFTEGVDVAGKNEVVPLIGPKLIDHLDPSELPGADGKPKSPKDPSDPNGGELKPNVDVSVEFNGPKAPGEKPREKLEIPEEYRKLADVILRFGEFNEWPPTALKFIKTVKESMEAFQTAVDADTTASAEAQAAKKILDAAATGSEFVRIIVNKLAGYKTEFDGDILEGPGGNQALRSIAVFTSAVQDLSKLVGIGFDIVGVCSNLMIVADSKKPKADRLKAALALKSVTGLPASLAWIGEKATTWLPGLSGSIVTGVNAVRTAAGKAFNKLGGNTARDFVTNLAEKSLKTCAEHKDVQAAIRLGEEIAGKITAWGAARLAKVTSDAALMEALSSLGAELTAVCEMSMSLPAAAAYEYIKWELEFTANLYKSISHDLPIFLSATIFGGKTIVQWKNEVNSHAAGTPDAFFKWAFDPAGFLASSRYDIRGGWLPTTWAQLPGVELHDFSGTRYPVEVLAQYPMDIKKLIIAPRLQGIAIGYLDAQFEKATKT